MSSEGTARITITLPAHLRTLAQVTGPVTVETAWPATLGAVLTALETQFPPLVGTIRDRRTGLRRPFVRFYACRQDLSNLAADELLPEEVARGEERLLIIGAMAGG